MREQHAPNHLRGQTSPYLKLHADNPVDWWPWCDEALAKARGEERLIFLSIGYAACHWCHVMARESFEDEQIAALLNRRCVSIKVDREERPDLDRIYQTAHQLLAGRGGGWPLSLFLDPRDFTPLFSGTYFPPEPRLGLPGFGDVVRRVDDYYRKHRDALGDRNEEIRRQLHRLAAVAPSGDVPEASLADAAVEAHAVTFDARHGGFGDAPKFPQPAALELLLDRAGADERARGMALRTLERMRAGGLHDHVGGGFFRYCVDAAWRIPHFEKMLCDNGLLLGLYARAHAATGAPRFADAGRRTVAWMEQTMRDPGGGFCASLSAESEGEEGRFYVWTREEVRELLGAEAYPAFARRYGLVGPPNFEGRWHLVERGDAGDERPMPEAARERLLAARRKRPSPARDDKVLAAWNALAVRGLALAARHLEEPACADAACAAVDFMRRHMWRDGLLAASRAEGKTQPHAFLDDHAFMLDALIELAQVRFRLEDLDWARELAETLLDRFADPDAGGFFFTPTGAEPPMVRPRPFLDEMLPGGNGVAARALIRLGHLLAEPRYREAAESTLAAGAAWMRRMPNGCDTMFSALAEWHAPPQILVLRGEGEPLRRWRRRALAPHAPGRICLALANGLDLPEPLAVRAPRGEIVAYPCRGGRCDEPITDEAAFEALLRAGEAKFPG